MRELQARKQNRMKDYDYSQNGAYFITICSKNRMELFGNIINAPYEQNSPVGATVLGRPLVHLSEVGKMIENAILYYNEMKIDTKFDRYIIMPNHLHAIVVIAGETGDRGRSPLQVVVRNLKSYVTKNIGFSPWQKSFYDHIIRNEQDYSRIAEYIENNPANWQNDRFYKTTYIHT